MVNRVVASPQSRGSRTVTGGRIWLSRALVVTQVVFSLVVLVSAGLLVRGLQNLRAVDTGFDRTRTLVFDVNEFFNTRGRELTRSGSGPCGSGSNRFPASAPRPFPVTTSTSGISMNTSVTLLGTALDAKSFLRVNSVSPGYFRTVGTRILYGREFSPADIGPSARFAIVNESAARKLFGNEPALGKLISRVDPSAALRHD